MLINDERQGINPSLYLSVSEVQQKEGQSDYVYITISTTLEPAIVHKYLRNIGLKNVQINQVGDYQGPLEAEDNIEEQVSNLKKSIFTQFELTTTEEQSLINLKEVAEKEKVKLIITGDEASVSIDKTACQILWKNLTSEEILVKIKKIKEIMKKEKKKKNKKKAPKQS